VQTTRLAESFELVTGSVALTRPEKLPCKATCDPSVFVRTTLINPDVELLSLYWKLGYNPSLLILWITCWGLWFKSYDL